MLAGLAGAVVMPLCLTSMANKFPKKTKSVQTRLSNILENGKSLMMHYLHQLSKYQHGNSNTLDIIISIKCRAD